MRVLVTGGAGYVGSVLVPALLEDGHSVTVVDSFLYRQNSLAHVCSNPRFEVHRGDVRQIDFIKPLVREADAVIPLAALVGAPLCDRDPVGATTTNRDAALALIQLLSPNQMLLMPTTNSAYGSGDGGKHCDEDTPLRPISLYARDKVEVERALLERPSSISFRLATVFGMSPRMRLDLLVNDLTFRALRDRSIVLFEPHFTRNYVHVRDVARAFLFGLASFDRLKGRAYNVGLSEANLTKRQLCDRIAAHVPGLEIFESPQGRDPDQRNYIVSNARIEKAGFKPIVGLDEGIRELIKGYRMLSVSRYANV